MKIEKDTENELTLKQSFFSYYIFGAFFVLIAVPIAVYAVTIFGSEEGVTSALFVLGLGILFFVGGIALFLKGGKRYVTLNKNTNELLIENQRLTDKSKSVYDLSKAVKLVINHTMESSGTSRDRDAKMKQVQYFNLQFSDGNVINLGSVTQGTLAQIKSAVSGSSLPPYIQRVVEITGVEVEHVNESLSIGGIVNSLKGDR